MSRSPGEQAAMLCERPEAAEEVEDLPAVLVDVVHALGALDLHLVEAEQLHEVQLAGVQVALEQVGHPRHVERLGVLDREQRRLGELRRRQFGGGDHGAGLGDGGSGHHGHGCRSPHSAGACETACASGCPSLARYSV
jgi:hypothetical protein